MIQDNNLQDVLQSIGFIADKDKKKYYKKFDSCIIDVDFEKKTISYPENKGLIVNDKTTSNFDKKENFVVLECVCRLLEKGYRPEHIELEPRWNLGHEAKGGKADILVRDENNKPLLIVECKTFGSEFNKEKKNTEADGGQLFSYWQQENATRWLALYASDWDGNEIKTKCLVINCTDDANILKLSQKDKNILTYSSSHNDRERYEVWKETYQCLWLDNIIFSNESQAYQIGIPPLRKKQLKDFTPEDSIVNRFEEILRHNNVSDKENAFNRLVALFISKLFDEIKKQDFDEVDFQYKQGSDTYESLQDRLQRLHQQGMEEFMKEKIFYVEGDYAEKLFRHYTGKQRKAAIEDLNKTIRILKFYSNNDFAFKEVHNEELFYQNGKILVEVVQLFQPYRIVYPRKHQFLGDLFERLLTKGFKQNEGQFFTPTPITRFIWDSLPVQSYISDNNLPKIIDYACGAGHFLTEAIEAVNAIRNDEDNVWVEKNIYGIEKDYRLARVSKISLFMNGAGNGNIIFGDGLENYPEYGVDFTNFDILVANPPYSVSSFKQHLKLRNNSFEILPLLSNDGSEIETLFIERASQLLKPKGLAAIILPSSILSNDSNSYIYAREILLKNFYIHGIVGFGSKTFGETGTATIVLFLERFNEPPKVSVLNQDIIDAIFTGNISPEWEEKEVLEAYLEHQKIDIEQYKGFIQKSLTLDQLRANEYFNIYVEDFSQRSFKYPKASTQKEREKIYLDKLYSFILALEKDKMYYFSLIWQQNTVIISAPGKTSEQKEFLGYKWSKRKGSEGIVITKYGGKMFNEKDRFARGTLACAIRNSFLGATTDLSEELSQFVEFVSLKDIVDFSRPYFNKSIRLKPENTIVIKSKFKLEQLGKIADVQKGSSITQSETRPGQIKVVAGGLSYAYYHNVANRKAGIITVSASGANAGFVNYWDEPIFASDCTTVMGRNEIQTKYIFAFLQAIQNQIFYLQKGAGQPHVYPDDLKTILIPKVKKQLQKVIVEEWQKVKDDFNNSRMTIEEYRERILRIFEKHEVILSNEEDDDE